MRLLVMVIAVALSAVEPASGDALAPCNQVPGNLVQNCSFQSADFSHYSVTAGPYTFVAFDPFALVYYAAFGDVNKDGIVSQNIATQAGTTYSVNFFLSSDGLTPNNFSVNFGSGSPIYSASNIPAEQYVLLSFLVQATGSNTVLSFTGGNLPGFLGLNDISVVPTTAAVPEPCSLLLLATLLMLTLAASRVRPAGRDQVRLL